jgi:hypothetical protein
MQLVFYGYCELELEDAIAIDNIVLQSLALPTSTSVPEDTTFEDKTTETPTTKLITETSTVYSQLFYLLMKLEECLIYLFFILLFPTACDQYLNTTSGTISSPNFPFDYFNSIDCLYTIDLQHLTGIQIMLNFTSFNTETFYDVVSVMCCSILLYMYQLQVTNDF